MANAWWRQPSNKTREFIVARTIEFHWFVSAYTYVYMPVYLLCVYVPMCICMCVQTYIYLYLPIVYVSRHVYVRCSHFSTCISTDHVIYLRNTLCAQVANKQTNLVTNQLFTRIRVFLEKLTVPQLVKKSAAFYGSWRVITVIIRARHFYLSWVR